MEMDDGDGFDSIAEIVDVELTALLVGGMFVESFDDVVLVASLDNSGLLGASCISCGASPIELTELETFSIGSTDISITEPSCPSFAPSFASRDSSSTSSSEWRYLRTFALSVSSSS